MTDNYDKVSDAISDDQLAHSEQETELQELRDRIAQLATPQGAAGVLLRELGGKFDPKNDLWSAIIDAVSQHGAGAKIRGSDGILIALRAIAGGTGE